MKPEIAFLCLAVAAYFSPEVAASAFGGTRAAWTYVLSGVEAAALWAALGVTTSSLLVRCVATWGVFEASQRPICRLAFPMDRAPNLPEGVNLCDAALGVPMSWVSVGAALFLAALAQEGERVAEQ